jgi:hypothetical protein
MDAERLKAGATQVDGTVSKKKKIPDRLLFSLQYTHLIIETFDRPLADDIVSGRLERL